MCVYFEVHTKGWRKSKRIAACMIVHITRGQFRGVLDRRANLPHLQEGRAVVICVVESGVRMEVLLA